MSKGRKCNPCLLMTLTLLDNFGSFITRSGNELVVVRFFQ
jgi:hypothetical protein